MDLTDYTVKFYTKENDIKMSFVKRMLAYYLYIVRYLSLVTSIIYMLSPILFILLYILAQKDYNFMISMYDGSYPWNLIVKPIEYFAVSGKAFFTVVVEYFISYAINSYINNLK